MNGCVTAHFDGLVQAFFRKYAAVSLVSIKPKRNLFKNGESCCFSLQYIFLLKAVIFQNLYKWKSECTYTSFSGTNSTCSASKWGRRSRWIMLRSFWLPTFLNTSNASLSFSKTIIFSSGSQRLIDFCNCIFPSCCFCSKKTKPCWLLIWLERKFKTMTATWS